MSNATPVNSQITDSVTQSNVKVLGEAPAMAGAQIFQNLEQVAGLDQAALSTEEQDPNEVTQVILIPEDPFI